MWGRLKKFDAYPKLHDDMSVKTTSGAAVSIVAIIFIVFLFFSELSYFMTTTTEDHLFVDVSKNTKIKINIDVVFHHIPCAFLSLDAMDITGARQEETTSHMVKKPLDRRGNIIGSESSSTELGEDKLTEEDATTPQAHKVEGAADPTDAANYCGSCYGARAEGMCCNTCDVLRQAYQQKGWNLNQLDNAEQCLVTGKTHKKYMQLLNDGQGCQMAGYLEVNRVAGNFHFTPGKAFQYSHLEAHDTKAFEEGLFNVSHTINELAFGDSYPGVVNPLDGVMSAVSKDVKAAMYIYYAKVVPTQYTSLYGTEIDTNQFSVTEHSRPVAEDTSGVLPGVYVFYELSPIMVKFKESRESFSHFLTQLCAILGGIFTVAGIVDRVVYKSLKHFKKNQMGKLS